MKIKEREGEVGVIKPESRLELEINAMTFSVSQCVMSYKTKSP